MARRNFKKKLDATEANAHRFAAHSTIGSTKYTDDMSAQGWVEFMFYTHGSADLDHALGCPGCDPIADSKPELKQWFEIENYWQSKGDPPRCPVRCAEWFKEKMKGKLVQ